MQKLRVDVEVRKSNFENVLVGTNVTVGTEDCTKFVTTATYKLFPIVAKESLYVNNEGNENKSNVSSDK